MTRGHSMGNGPGNGCGSGGNGPVPLAKFSLFGQWWQPFHKDRL